MMTEAHAQKQYLEVVNLKTNRPKKIREKKRITVFTKDSKVRGPLKILDHETILIKDTEVKIGDIVMVKNKSIVGKIFAYVLLPMFTFSTLGILAITGASGSTISAIGITGLSLTIISILSRKKYKTERYKFKIVND
ncbi:hypothetical protein WPG_0120 [Winogradskyella sp. PG-2]|nr:hypothetical protein WPG_0120 [Winogradskyella sp. PG-2]